MTPLSRPTVIAGLLVGVAAISTSAVLARLAMGDDAGVLDAGPGAAPALAVAFWRTAGGALALMPAAARARSRAGTLAAPRDHLLLAGSGLALAAHFALFQGSLALTSIASAVTLATMSPLFVALGSRWLLRETPTRRVWLGMAVTVAGSVTIGVADATGHAWGPHALGGDAMALGSALAVTGYLLVGRATRVRVGAAAYSAVVYAWAALALLAVCLATGVTLTGYAPTVWAALAGVVLGPQLLGHTVFNTLLSTVSATVVSIAVLSEPVGAGLLGWLVFGELPARGFWLGGPLVLAGVAVATVGRRRSAAAANAATPP